MIKTLEAQVGQFLLGCNCPVCRGNVVQEQDPVGDFPAAFLLDTSSRLDGVEIAHVASHVSFQPL